MNPRQAANPWPTAKPARSISTVSLPSSATHAILALSWAGLASTLYRVRRGEGALLAINLSLLAYPGLGLGDTVPAAVISIFVIGLMYAFNDLWDAPTDGSNPKKDRTLVATYLAYRTSATVAVVALKILTLTVAFAVLDARAALAVAGTMFVNVVYSMWLKGVPVVDVVWCGLWGALYAAITGAPVEILVLVGLMTAVCHLYQALDDRVADARNGVVTTAVQSRALSRSVLFVLSVLLVVSLRGSLGGLWAVTAFTPLLILVVSDRPRSGWILTKLYFGVVWLCVLELARAAG